MNEPGRVPQIPYRAPDAPRVAPPPRRATRVNFPRGPIHLPGACACCLAPPQGSAFQSIPYGAWHTFRHVDFEVPYCAACLRHQDIARRRRLLSGLVAASVGIAAPVLALSRWAYAPRVAVGCSGAVAALATLLALRAWFALRPIALRRECARVDPAVTPMAATTHDVDLRVDNSHYAQRMQEEHAAHRNAGELEGAWTDDVDERARRRPRRPLRLARMPWRSALHTFWLVGPAAGFFAGYVALRAGYGRVYFDNPGTHSLEVHVEGGPTLSVPPREWTAAWIPTGERQFAVNAEGRTVDQISAAIAPGESYVYAPGEGACYARLTERLLSEQDSTPAAEGAESLRRRWVTVPAVDYVLEPFPFQTSYRAGDRPTVDTRFARVRCGTRVPDED